MAIIIDNTYIKATEDGKLYYYESENYRNNGNSKVKASTIKNFCETNLKGINLKINRLLKGKKTKLKKASEKEAAEIISSIDGLFEAMKLKADMEQYLKDLKEAQGTTYSYIWLRDYFKLEDIIKSIPKPEFVLSVRNNFSTLEEFYNDIKQNKRLGDQKYIDC